jgi:hypothetical protein
MEAVPWQAIETGRDIGLDHRIVSVPGNDGTALARRVSPPPPWCEDRHGLDGKVVRESKLA